MCISVSMIPTRPPTFDEICLQLPPSGLPSPLLCSLPASHCCLVSGLPHWQGTGKQAVPQRVSTASEHCKKLSDLRVPPQSSTRGKGSAGAWGQGKWNAGNKELGVVNAQKKKKKAQKMLQCLEKQFELSVGEDWAEGKEQTSIHIQL